ncbi:hypothetical protein LCGC14_0663220 [marine sediment metagenome]|uniref:Uncharacterized protein n=1 Tax=marine sediment metagenome TaxID=412755 RepID=A0A0F9QY37_9ZZZZ
MSRMVKPLRAITLWQPWASAIALGWKQAETRGRRTLHRGPIAIHAAKVWGPTQRTAARRLAGVIEKPAHYFDNEPRGAVVCVADLVDCIEMTEGIIIATPQLEIEFGGWEVGRWAWYLENVQSLLELDPGPLELRGRQSMWTLTRDETQEIRRRLA